VTAHDLVRRLKEKTIEAGFDAVGVAESGVPHRDADALTTWLGSGRHSGMTWMARHPERRVDPAKVLAGCRSVVVVAMNYWRGPDWAAVRPGHAGVALYARGRDYHKVMGTRLKRLAAWLEEASGRPARAFVDTGPVLERAWAERAGVGWIGKNANLLTRTMGSWVLLGEILSGAVLEPAAGPHPDHCGTCTACIEACPTGAIVAPGVVDANRCISYWTIEHRRDVPEERRRDNGGWMFGCDDCQTVCPWNLSFAREAAVDPFSCRADLRGLDPIEILGMEENAFRSRFSGTSLMRARWDGLRRNACIVLGNRSDAIARRALERAARDRDPVVRSHARWAMERVRRDLPDTR
jgi:epoxyqueuosine reductase